jgi:hypothetical protein
MNAVTVSSLHRRWLPSAALGTLAGGTIFIVLIAGFGGDEFWQHLRAVDGTDLAVYTGLTLITYAWRTWRFRLFLGSDAPFPKLYGVVCVHTLMVNVLPVSAGELFYPLLVKRYRMASRWMEGMSHIVVARAQDLAVTIAFLVVAAVWVGGVAGSAQARALAMALGGGSLVLMAGGYWLSRSSRWPFRGWSALARWRAEFAASLRQISSTAWIGSLGAALAARIAAIGATYWLLRAIDISLPWSALFLLCNLYVLLPLLPTNAIAGLGTTEAFLFAYLLGQGIPAGPAAAASLQIHGLQLVIAGLLGAGGTALLKLTGRPI